MGHDQMGPVVKPSILSPNVEVLPTHVVAQPMILEATVIVEE